MNKKCKSCLCQKIIYKYKLCKYHYFRFSKQDKLLNREDNEEFRKFNKRFPVEEAKVKSKNYEEFLKYVKENYNDVNFRKEEKDMEKSEEGKQGEVVTSEIEKHYFVIDGVLAQTIFDYLKKRPYQEVSDLVAPLSEIKTIKEHYKNNEKQL